MLTALTNTPLFALFRRRRLPWLRTLLSMELNAPFTTAELDEVDLRIIELVTEGCANKDIALRVFLSCQTVRNRLTRIFDITGAGNRTQLAVMWLHAAR